MDQHDERRQHKRFDTSEWKHNLQLAAPETKDEITGSGRLRNISFTGFCFDTPLSVTRGGNYNFWLDLSGPQLGTVKGTMEVVWVKANKQEEWTAGAEVVDSNRGWLGIRQPAGEGLRTSSLKSPTTSPVISKRAVRSLQARAGERTWSRWQIGDRGATKNGHSDSATTSSPVRSRILIASPVHEDAIEILRGRHDVVCGFEGGEADLASQIEDCEILVFRSDVQVSGKLLSRGRNLRLLIRAGSGVENVDLNYVTRHRLALISIPGPGTRAVAEMTFALMLALARQIIPADKELRQGHWLRNSLSGLLLENSTLGIVGAGNVGCRVGEMAAAWGMNVLGCVERRSTSRRRELAERGIRLVGVKEVLAESDFVSVHVPLKESTKNLIGAAQLATMKSGALLLHMAQGGVVDEQALYEALTAPDGLAGAALDAHVNEGDGWISPLAGLSNVILTPHLGAITTDSQRQTGFRVVETIEQFLAGETAKC